MVPFQMVGGVVISSPPAPIPWTGVIVIATATWLVVVVDTMTLSEFLLQD